MNAPFLLNYHSTGTEAELWRQFQELRSRSPALRAVDDPLVKAAWAAWAREFTGSEDVDQLLRSW
jgi:hypothetical protein